MNCGFCSIHFNFNDVSHISIFNEVCKRHSVCLSGVEISSYKWFILSIIVLHYRKDCITIEVIFIFICKEVWRSVLSGPGPKLCLSNSFKFVQYSTVELMFPRFKPKFCRLEVKTWDFGNGYICPRMYYSFFFVRFLLACTGQRVLFFKFYVNMAFKLQIHWQSTGIFGWAALI